MWEYVLFQAEVQISHTSIWVYTVKCTCTSYTMQCILYVRACKCMLFLLQFSVALCFVCHFVGFENGKTRWLAVRIWLYVLWLYRFKKPFTKLHWQVSMCCKCVNDHTIWCIDFGFLFFKKRKLFEKCHPKFQISLNIHVSLDTHCEMRWIAMHLLQLIFARWKFINIIHMCIP